MKPGEGLKPKAYGLSFDGTTDVKLWKSQGKEPGHQARLCLINFAWLLLIQEHMTSELSKHIAEVFAH